MISALTHKTERLQIDPLSIQDASFILELVNSPGWLNFIGNRNVNTEDDAHRYVEKIRNSPSQIYWTVKMKETKNAVGVITLIKRDYLEHRDIGFAFLPQFGNQGLAFEAVQSFLPIVCIELNLAQVLATTNPTNEKSINLLIKLGMKFTKEIEAEGKVLRLYNLDIP